MSNKYAYLVKIRKWDTAELVNTLEMNGLEDCCHAIKKREIDGNSFLELNEVKLAFWRQDLNNTQIRRLWSIVQLANENPKNFIVDTVTTKQRRSHSPQNKKENLTGTLQRGYTNQSFNDQQNNIKNVQKLHNEPFKYQEEPAQNERDFQNNATKNFTKELENIIGQQPTSNTKQLKNFPPKPLHLSGGNNSPTQLSGGNNNSPTHVSGGNNNSPPHLSGGNNNSTEQISSQMSQVETNNSFLYNNIDENTSKYRNIPEPSLKSRPLPSIPLENSFSPEPNITLRQKSYYPNPPNPTPIATSTLSKQEEEQFNLPRPPPLPVYNHSDSFDSDPEEHPNYDAVYDQPYDYKLESWYHNIKREEVNNLLQGAENGKFIVRPSKQVNQECTISLIHGNRIFNVPIKKENDKVILADQSFNTVQEIIEYSFENPLVLKGRNDELIFVKLQF